MLVDRYPPADLFALVPKLMAEFEPVLRTLDRLLDDDTLFQRVKADLARRAPHSLTLGRPGTPVEVVLRLLVVKRLYGWSYGEVERFVGDSLVLRQFCRIYLKPVPDDTTLLRWANLIEPATLVALNERVVALARGPTPRPSGWRGRSRGSCRASSGRSRGPSDASSRVRPCRRPRRSSACSSRTRG